MSLPLSIDDLPLDWQRAAALVSAGGVVVLPTDTVYGLACDPRSAGAVERIYAVKGRPAGLELSLLAAEPGDLDTLVELGPAARRLAEAFWPGPLSIVAPAREPRRHLAVPRQGATLMVRIPDHDELRHLLLHVGPLATTSANRHGAPPAVTAGEAAGELGDEVDLVVDAGAAGGRASTIIDCTSHPPRVLRAGPLSDDELRPYLGG